MAATMETRISPTSSSVKVVLYVWAGLLQNKKERKKVREVGILKKDPDAIKEQIRKLEMMSAWAFSFLCFTYIGCCIVHFPYFVKQKENWM